MSQYANRVVMTVTGTPGTGTVTLNAATSGFQTLGAAFAANATVDVFITDGAAWEVARNCTYTHSGTTLTRGTREASSTGAALSLTSAAVVTLTVTASTMEDLDRQLDRGFCLIQGDGVATTALTQVVNTKLSAVLATVANNPRSEWSVANKRFTPTRAGNYLVIAGAHIGSTSGSLSLSITRNNPPVSFGSGAYGVNVPGQVGTVVVVASANGTTDFFEVYAYTDQASIVVGSHGPNTFFSATYLGP